MKNYIGFVNDHSGSMGSKAAAAMQDYNATITAIKDAASREMLDTVVSVVGVGVGKHRPELNNSEVERQVMVSNPHVLRPKTNWPTPGGTPLWDGIMDMIALHQNLPDIQSQDVSVLISVTTDGRDEYSRMFTKEALGAKIRELQATGRWTFVFRVPKGYSRYLEGLGVPSDNIQEWENSAAGMAASTQAQTKAVDAYFTLRSTGAKSSNVFYSSTAAVDTSKLTDISKDVSLYIVGDSQDGIMVKDFILTKRMEYLVGAAFYQLIKTEARVQPHKLILIRDRKTGAVYAGSEARSMLGLDTINNARVHPNHGNGNYDIFIQSESVNRKLPKGTGVLYWTAKGRKMTEDDLKYLQPKVAAPAVPVLPSAPATGRPTPSPIKPSLKTPSLTTPCSVGGRPVKWFAKRDEARAYYQAHHTRTSAMDGRDWNLTGPNGERWYVVL